MPQNKLFQLLANLPNLLKPFRQRLLVDVIFGGLAVTLIVGPAILIFSHFSQVQAQIPKTSQVEVSSLSAEEIATIQAQQEIERREKALAEAMYLPALPSATPAPSPTAFSATATAAAIPFQSTAAVVVPAQNAFSAPPLRVPSLMYHHIRKLSGLPRQAALDRYSTDPQLFIQELDWLQANGYHTVTVSQIADYLFKGTPLPDKPINLRFDDGWQNQLFAAQEMHKRGLNATFFIISQANTGPYMSREQVRSLDAQGFEVAAHTRSHPQLTRLASSRAQTEIVGSKQDLENLLGHPVRSFAYPYGDVNPQIETLAKAAGFDIALGVGHGYTWTQASRFREPAISMESLNTLPGFINRVTAAK